MSVIRGRKRIVTALVILSVIIMIAYIGLQNNITTKGMNHYSTEHYEIYYESLSDQTLKDLETQLEETYDTATPFFGEGVSGEEKYSVIVYKDVETFQKSAYGLFVALYLQDWAVGASSMGLTLLTSPENPDETHSYEDMIEVAAHEWIHTRVFSVKEMADIWIDEGAATYFSGQKQPFIGEYPSIEALSKQGISDFVDAEGYCYSYYYFEYLYTHFSREEVINLIKTDDYGGSLGISKEQVYTDWIEEMSQIKMISD